MATEARAVLVVGEPAATVARAVAELRSAGARTAGFVGADGEAAREMAGELLGESATIVPVTPEG